MVTQPYPPFQSRNVGLIVHADDLGLSEKVNQGILLAHTKGLVTSASIMAVGAAFENAVHLCRETPSLDVGVHLTLTGERPLLPAADIPSLVDGEGRFHGHATTFSRRYILGKIRTGEVRSELDAQLRKVLDAGITVSHIDSHQHVHMLPRVYGVALDLAKKYAIPAVRIPREDLSWRLFRQTRSVMRVLQLLVLNGLCRHASAVQAPPLRAEHFAGFLFGGNLNALSLRFVLDNLPRSGWCELMCHPGLDDPQSPYKHWGYRWDEELEALQLPELRNLLRQSGVPLVSYRQLARRSLSDR